MSDPEQTGPFVPGQPTPPAGPTIGRFILGQELGRGAFGVVCRAYDPALGREVAVKLPMTADATPELVDRFAKEARSAAGLRHPNIVTVFDVGVDAGRPFIAMELIDGPTLAERLRERIAPRQAAEWVRDLALALHHAHAAGVVHRDVKPGNVLLEAGRRVRLTDFGISKLSPGQPAEDDSTPVATADGVVMGSPAYMSPEQARGEVAAVGPASDQYSLGVVLYEMLAGRRPFTGSAREALRQSADPDAHPPAPRELDPSIPLGLEAVALKAMRKAPADRYPSAADVAVDLQRWLKGDAVSAPLRVPEGWALRCPECGLGSRPPAAACKFCGHDLAGVEPSEPVAPPRYEPEDSRRGPFWTRDRLVRVGQWAVWLIVMAAAGAVFVVNWRAAVEQAGGWNANPRPGFLDTMPPFKTLGPLWRGILLGVAGVGVGLVAAAAWAGSERARGFVELARWAAAGGTVLLAVWVETTTRYPQHTRYRLKVTVRSESGRAVKKTTVRVMKKSDKEQSLHNRVYIDQARLRAYNPELDAAATQTPPFYPGSPPDMGSGPNATSTRELSYSRSPLGFVFEPDPDRIFVIVSYEDGVTGSCQCDDGVQVGFWHDHHTLTFPLRLVVDANPEAVRWNWRESRRDGPDKPVEPTRVTIRVP